MKRFESRAFQTVVQHVPATLERVIVALHGAGSHGGDVVTLGGALGELAASTAVVAPTAPAIPYSVADGEEWHVWFDRRGYGPGVADDEASMDASLGRVGGLVAEVKAAFGADTPVWLLGFSQGASLVLHDALRRGSATAAACAGAVAIGGYNSKSGETRIGGANPLHVMAGEWDDVIPAAWSQSTFERLGGRPNTHWQLLPKTGHFFTKQSYRAVRDALKDGA